MSVRPKLIFLREGGDIGLFISLVPKVLQFYLFEPGIVILVKIRVAELSITYLTVTGVLYESTIRILPCLILQSLLYVKDGITLNIKT